MYATFADSYIAKGWHPLPLPKGKKAPPPDGYTGRKGRTPTSDEYAHWKEARGDWDIGVRLPPGVVGIDIDLYRDNGARTIAELEERFGPLPPCPKTTSRSDGSAILFMRAPGSLDLPGGLGPGVDVIQWFHRFAKTAGEHPSNSNEYRWILVDGTHSYEPPDIKDLPELPQAWIEGLATLKSERQDFSEFEPAHAGDGSWHPKVTEAFNNAQGHLAGLGSVSRHDGVLGEVMVLAQCLASEAQGAYQALSGLEELFVNALGPDRGSDEARDEYARMRDGAIAKAEPIRLHDYSEWEAHLERERLRNPPVSTVVERPASRLELLELAVKTEEDLANLPPPTWLIPGWIQEGSITSIWGPSGAGKTFYALDIILTLATGQRFWHGIPLETQGKKMNILYLVGEGVSGYHGRIAAWREARGITEPANITYIPASEVNLRDPEWVDAVEELSTDLNAQGIVLDTVSQFSGAMAENSAEEMMQFVNGCRRLKGDNERTIMPIHHSGKNLQMGSRGHSSFYGALDYEIRVTWDEERSIMTTKLTKARDSETGLTRTWERRIPEGHNSLAIYVPSNEPTAEELSESQRRIMVLIASHLDEGITQTQIKEELGKSKAWVSSEMTTLRGNYQVRWEEEGQTKRYWTA